MYLCKDLHLKLIAYVILENHIHLLLYVKNSDSIPQFLRRFKSYTSRQIIKNLSSEDRHIWQRGTFDHVIRDDDDLWTHIDYIHYNPVKHEYIKSQRNWKWSSFKQYIKNGYYKYGFCKDNNVNNKYYNYGEYDM
jgi:putative transposase